MGRYPDASFDRDRRHDGGKPRPMKSALKTMTGVITIVQEGRFKMEPED
jgi:hypothetical protein